MESSRANGNQIPAAAPLRGIRVVDLSRYLPGPLVSRLLADLGAEVVKVEEPKLGDPSRMAPPLVSGRGSLAALLLSGHRSIALDLKKETARNVLEDLLLSADVLVESFRPGVLESMGLAPARLRELCPSLVICSVTGFGQEGPHAHRAGHDLTYQAIAGSLASGAGMPSVQVADIVGAWGGALAVAAALLRRQQTGEGAHVDLALLDAAGHAAITAWAAEADGEKGRGEPLPLTGALPCYDLYRTRDDRTLALAALEPKFWATLCAALGEKELVRQQYSGDPAVRRRVEQLVRQRTSAEWAAVMDELDIPAEPVLSLAESLGHPQVRARGMVARGADGLYRLGFPALFDGQRPLAAERFPELGGDTEALLHEHGLDSGLSRGDRRRGGIGQRFSFRRWAAQLADAVVSRRKK
jgi:alpha-methylacyl-CoA racemase